VFIMSLNNIVMQLMQSQHEQNVSSQSFCTIAASHFTILLCCIS
jgi:membrane-anchored protein YejM (alkaline phosphatase superfamily)